MNKADGSTQSGLVLPKGSPVSQSNSVAPASPDTSGLGIFKFALKAAAVAFVPLSIGVGTAYYEAWWGAFGLDESLLRGDFLNLHLVSLNLALKAYLAVSAKVLLAVIGIVVLGYVGSLFAERAERKFIKWIRVSRARQRHRRPASDLKWVDRGQRVHSIAANFLMASLVCMGVVVFPIQYAAKWGRENAASFMNNGYVYADKSSKAAFFTCAAVKGEDDKPDHGLLLACGSHFCALVLPDGTPSAVPLSSIIETKTRQLPVEQFLKAPAYKACAGL